MKPKAADERAMKVKSLLCGDYEPTPEQRQKWFIDWFLSRYAKPKRRQGRPRSTPSVLTGTLDAPLRKLSKAQRDRAHHRRKRKGRTVAQVLTVGYWVRLYLEHTPGATRRQAFAMASERLSPTFNLQPRTVGAIYYLYLKIRDRYETPAVGKPRLVRLISKR
jgi:hypothetical protein